MFATRILLTVLALAVAMPSIAATKVVPVIVGSESELDACMSIGHAIGSNAVRTAPRAGAAKSGVLSHGHIVWVCDQKGPDGKTSEWYGIVYGPAAKSHAKNGLAPSCGVNQPIKSAKAYRGPCKSGWVRASQIQMDAG